MTSPVTDNVLWGNFDFDEVIQFGTSDWPIEIPGIVVVLLGSIRNCVQHGFYTSAEDPGYLLCQGLCLYVSADSSWLYDYHFLWYANRTFRLGHRRWYRYRIDGKSVMFSALLVFPWADRTMHPRKGYVECWHGHLKCTQGLSLLQNSQLGALIHSFHQLWQPTEPKYISRVVGMRYSRTLPRVTIQKVEVKSYRRMHILVGIEDWKSNRWPLTHRVGPCDVTSKSDLEKLIKEISLKEKYLNLLSMLYQWVQVHYSLPRSNASKPYT